MAAHFAGSGSPVRGYVSKWYSSELGSKNKRKHMRHEECPSSTNLIDTLSLGRLDKDFMYLARAGAAHFENLLKFLQLV